MFEHRDVRRNNELTEFFRVFRCREQIHFAGEWKMAQICDSLDVARVNLVPGKELLVIWTERTNDVPKIAMEPLVLDAALLRWRQTVPCHRPTNPFSRGNAACA